MVYVKRQGWPQTRISMDPVLYGLLYADAGAAAGASGNTVTYEASGIVTKAVRQYYENLGRLPATPAEPRRTVT